jgi:hypothetical protein
VIGTLASLAVRLKTETRRLQQPSHFQVTHFKAIRLERPSQDPSAFAGPPQRGHRISTGLRFHQSFEGRNQPRLLVLTRLPATPNSPLAIRGKRTWILEFKNPIANRSIRNPRRDSNRSDSTSPKRQRFGRSPTSPSSLVQVLSDIGELPSNPFDDVCLWHPQIMTDYSNHRYTVIGSLLISNALPSRIAEFVLWQVGQRIPCLSSMDGRQCSVT